MTLFVVMVTADGDNNPAILMALIMIMFAELIVCAIPKTL